MKAIVYENYGGPEVLKLVELPQPAPAADEVLIKIHAAAVNPLDWHFMRGKPYIMRLSSGFSRPKQTRLGVDLAGVAEAVGQNVTRFKPGDAVFGSKRGAFGEYVCAKEEAVIAKPANFTFEQAAAVPVAAVTALQGLRDKAQVKPGQKVLINGAAGGVGTYAVQIAKAFGAHVTAVCSGRNVAMVRALGADRVIDYAQENFTQGAEKYDVMLDSIGNHPLRACLRVMPPTGVYVVVGGPDGRWLGPLAHSLKAVILSKFVSQSLLMFLAETNPKDLAVLKELMEANKLKSALDRCYPLSETAEAVRYLEAGHARGKVIVNVA